MAPGVDCQLFQSSEQKWGKVVFLAMLVGILWQQQCRPATDVGQLRQQQILGCWAATNIGMLGSNKYWAVESETNVGLLYRNKYWAVAQQKMLDS